MFWNENYDESMFGELRDIVFEELYRYKYRNILRGEVSKGPTHIKIVHTTDHRIEYKPFCDGVFIEEDVYKLGDYVIIYEDDSEARLPIIYGTNISNKDVSWTNRDPLLIEVAFTTYPIKLNNQTYYECIYENPYSNKKVKGMYLDKTSQNKLEVFVRNITFI